MLMQRGAILEALDAMADTGGALENAELILITNAPDLNRLLAPADLTEANFTGYASVTLSAWSAAYVDSTGRMVISAPDEVFTLTGTSVTQSVTGYAVLNDAETEVVGVHLFDAPIPLTNIGDGVEVNPEVVWGG